jgi:outer membrane receptor protein involved in Fe transport
MHLKKIIPLIIAMFAMPFMMKAQVTTSSLSGTVKDDEGKALSGASVSAVYTPSNIRYSAGTSAGGRFNISNMHSGGPYTITVTYVGHTTQTFDDVYLQLADVTVLEPKLVKSNTELTGVVVTSAGRKNTIINSSRTGASTTIGRAEIQRLPTITRSLNDITRLTPQSNGASVGGGNYRQNNITVDGADFNNNFGIGTNLPANGSPISLDAIDQISVSLTPFDVRQSGFIGSSLNAVTRAGTNQFSGSVYKYFRSGNEQGEKVGKQIVQKQSFNFQQYGVRFGGPIIKNKLFFFGSYETEDRPTILQNRTATPTGQPFVATNTGTVRPTVAEMDDIKSYLSSTYGYETGEYQNYSLKNGNTKILGRIDWNINKNNRFNIRYNQVEGGTPNAPSTSRSPLNAYPGGQTRTGQNALWFRNSNYFQGSNFYSVAAELNSTFGKRFTNTLRGTYTLQDDSRTSESADFPFVDILSGGTPFASFGYEPFTKGNLRKVKAYSFIDNFTVNLNKHLLTAGIQADFSKTTNGFQRFATSYYTFASWNDFKTGVNPIDFGITYSLSPGFAQAFPSFKFAQYSAFLQDEISTSDRFKLTLGLRADLPTYPDVSEIKTHPLIAAMAFNNGEKINTGALPKKRILFSPRLGFNWDVMGDKTMQIRGGAGIFTGKIPFVWIVSQSGDAGLLQVTQAYGVASGGTAVPGPFNPNPAAYLPSTVPAVGTVVPTAISALSNDFRFPQALKLSLAFDKRITKDLILTMEGVYNKDLYSAVFDNPNLVTPTALNVAGYSDNRLIYPNATNARFVNTLNGSFLPTPGGSTAFNTYVLKNGKKGYYASLTTKLEKTFSKGFAATVAYVASIGANLFDGSGDQPSSAWQSTATVNGSNNSPLAAAGFIVPSRVIASVSYAKEYLKHLKTTVSLFYEGQSQGRYSYTYTSDFNRDGNSNDLIYIPKDLAEITSMLVPKVSTTASPYTYTVAQQAEALEAYITQDKYLNKHRGQTAERNEGLFQFRSQLDFKLLQDIFVNVGKKRNTIQFSLDIFNFGNLINKDWGAVKTLTLNNFGNASLLVPQNVTSLVPGGTVKPTFNVALDPSGNLPTETYRTLQTTASTYFMQFGLRYIFN